MSRSTRRTIRCRSGLKGWEGRLQDQYSSFEEFVAYCEIYGNHARLGYGSPRSVWGANPTVQGSVIPDDYRRVSL